MVRSVRAGNQRRRGPDAVRAQARRIRAEPADAPGHAGDACPGGVAGCEGRVHHCGGRDAARGFALVAVADGVFCCCVRVECGADSEDAQGLKNGRRRIDHRVFVGA